MHADSLSLHHTAFRKSPHDAVLAMYIIFQTHSKRYKEFPRRNIENKFTIVQKQVTIMQRQTENFDV